MLYGLLADPATIFDNMVDIIRLLPAQAAVLINDQVANLIKTAAATHGFAVVPAVVIAFYGGSNAARGVVSSLNVIYDEDERRSFFHLTAISIVIALAVVCIICLGLFTASVTALLRNMLTDYGNFTLALIRVLTWLFVTMIAATAITLIYRYGPCRELAKWRWLSLGSITATLLWLAGSLVFGWYVAVAKYDTTYGSLGAVVALIMWLYVSAYAVLIGAFLDAEAERQTAQDSTTGKAREIGKRGAVVADTSAALAKPPE
jgi:membrane protein